MKRTLFSILGCMLAVTVLLSSCSKEGPAGAQGPAGPTGPSGPQGTQGIPGTSSVTYSDWMDATYQRVVFGPGDTAFVANIAAAKLDITMLNTGEIKVYLNLNTSAAPQIIPLPYADVFNGSFIYIQPYFSLQNIRLESDINPSSTNNTSGARIQQYRYVLIPGGTHTRSAINWNNYDEVKAYLGWTD